MAFGQEVYHASKATVRHSHRSDLTPRFTHPFMLLVWLTVPLAHAEEHALAAEERRLEELVGELEASTEGAGDADARGAALDGLRELEGELAALEGSREIWVLRSKIWYRIGTVECQQGNPAEGREALERSLTLDGNPERAARVQRLLGECDAPSPPPPPPLSAPEAPVAPTRSWQPESVQDSYVRETPSASRASVKRRGGGLATGGAVLGLAGGAAVLGTWYVYQSTPSMSSSGWLGLQVGNTIGWLALGGGGVLVVTGAASGLSVEFTPFVVPVR